MKPVLTLFILACFVSCTPCNAADSTVMNSGKSGSMEDASVLNSGSSAESAFQHNGSRKYEDKPKSDANLKSNNKKKEIKSKSTKN